MPLTTPRGWLTHCHCFCSHMKRAWSRYQCSECMCQPGLLGLHGKRRKEWRWMKFHALKPCFFSTHWSGTTMPYETLLHSIFGSQAWSNLHLRLHPKTTASCFTAFGTWAVGGACKAYAVQSQHHDQPSDCACKGTCWPSRQRLLIVTSLMHDTIIVSP